MFGGDGGVSPASSPRVGSTGSERATPEIAAITGGSNGSNGSPVSSQLPPAGPGSPGRWPQGAAPAPGSVGAVKQNTLAPAPVEEEDLEIEVRPPQSRCFLSLDSQAHRVVPRRRLTLKSPTGGTMTDPTDPTTTSEHPLPPPPPSAPALGADRVAAPAGSASRGSAQGTRAISAGRSRTARSMGLTTERNSRGSGCVHGCALAR